MKKAAVPSILIAVVLLALAVIAGAQQPKKIRQIGVSIAGLTQQCLHPPPRIRLALRDLGYLEGKNIAIEYRFAEGKLDRLPDLAAELVSLKVDVIVADGGYAGDPGGDECDQDDSHRFADGGGDPVDAGVIDSLARPGGNVTGITILIREN